ncbi:MAG TPA: glycosyltransferase family 4 protein [Methanobacterium sp.]|nr:glycosyltransferase family 4 protein [Methanobacterium sp.]
MAVENQDTSVFNHFHSSDNLKWKRRKNKILMVISYPDTRLKKELESFKKNGYDVSLIIWERSWPFPLDSDIEVKSLKLNVPVGHIKTLFYFPVWWCFLLFWLLKMRWDVIHSVNFDTFLFSMFIAKIKGNPIVYDIFDSYGDMMGRILRPIISNMDKFIMKFADAIIIADDTRTLQIAKNLKNNIVTINNTPEGSLFPEKDDINNHDDEFKIFLGGKIIEERGTCKIISAIKGMEDVKLIIKGFCSEENYKNKLFAMVNGMENVDMDLNGVPYEEIVQNMLEADLTIALYDPSIPNNKYASPNKLFESMASGIPIIVNGNNPMENIVRNEDCGLVIPFDNDKALRDAIFRVKNDPMLQKRLGNNGRKAYLNKYNWNIMEQRLIAIYDEFQELKA